MQEGFKKTCTGNSSRIFQEQLTVPDSNIKHSGGQWDKKTSRILQILISKEK